VAELFDPAMREHVIKDPTDLDALSRGLNELLRVRQDMQGVARATAERFTWDAYGAKLLKLIAGL
jgi:glycosyltransferase involved in cell wall biosynthesis